MNDTEPIEIEFAVKNYQLKQEFDNMIAKSADFDKSVDKSKAKFAEFIESQLKANGVLIENAQLTDQQTKSLERHYNMLDYLKKKIDETTDPTQVGVYTYQLQQAEEAIKEIINASNTKVEILNAAELAEQNKRLEEAGRTLDLIADKSFNFANAQELEVLANSINAAEGEMEQLGVVLDFVEAKLSDIDPNTQLFEDLKNDVEQANAILGRTPQIYDTAGNSIDELTDALKAFKAELATATNPDDIRVLNQNIENIQTRIAQLSNVGKTGFDEFGNKLRQQSQSAVSLQGELTRLVQKMAKLRAENKANTREYDELNKRAVEIRSALSTVRQEVNAMGSTTSGLDTLIRATTAISAGFNLAQGSAALFGSENENVQETIKKVTASMAILQSLQTIQAELKRKDTLLTQGQTAAQALYARVVGQSTGALKAFRIALAATGIGLFIILLAEFVTNWDKVKKAIGLTNDELERSRDIIRKSNELYGEQIAKLQLLEKQNRNVSLSERQKRDAVRDYNKEFGDLLGSVKDYKELEEKVIANVGNYVKYLNVKAQADAAYILSLEKQKQLLEEITALSTGDLSWYEKLQQGSDKMFNKFWGMFGIETENKTTLTNEEVLNILHLPTEEEQEKALSELDSTMRSRVKKLIKQQSESVKLLTSSNQLREQASSLANLYGITPDENNSGNKKANDLLKERLKVLEAIAQAEQDYLKNSLTGLDRDIKEIEQRYAKLREQATEAKLGENAITRINEMEAREITATTFQYNSDELIAQLEKEKELFKLFEKAKTLIGAEAIEQRYAEQLKGVSSYAERLQQEIDHIEVTPADSRTLQEQALLERLLQMKKQHEQELQDIEDNRYLSAYESTLTYQERILAIEENHRVQRIELEKIADAQLRDEKLKVLEQQKQDAVAVVENEVYEKGLAERRLIKELTDYSNKELENRLKSTEEYLKLYAESLSEDQKMFLENEVKTIQSIMGATTAISKQNALLKEKERIVKAIQQNTSNDPEIAKKLNKELEEVNFLIAENDKQALEFKEKIEIAVHTAKGLADAFGDSNEELQRVATTMSNLVTSIAQGNWAGAVLTVVDWLIKGVKDVVGRDRDAERRRQEEIIKRDRERHEAGLEYNRMLRERWMLEARLNDLYQSRVENIREELSVLERQYASAYEDYINTFLNLLDTQTEEEWRVLVENGILTWVEGVRRGGMFRNKIKISVAELLGIDEDRVILTDELFEKLEKLNSIMPLTGDAKEAYEQLKKLKEEYGSIEKAMRQLEIELQNRVTGTTAQALADSIRQGLSEGKRSFADFADDIEGFLRNAILSGMSTAILEPKMQELQDLLYNMLDDGVLTDEEREEFQTEYMKLAREAQQYLDMINQAGIDITGSNQANSLKGAIKGITEEQADLLAGQFGGMRLAQLETNTILRNAANYQMSSYSRMITLQEEISFNTNRTAANTTQIVLKLQELLDTNSGSSLQSAGL